MSAAPARSLSTATLTLLVVTSMIGTGVFSSSGVLIEALGNRSAVMLAWLVGGLGAVAGAMVYADLSAALPRNGGEYALLSRIYHPGLGFIAAFASLLAGFAGPVAAMALAFGQYISGLVPVEPRISALLLVLALSLPHALHLGRGVHLQNALTVAKLALIAGFLAAVAVLGHGALPASEPERPLLSSLVQPSFAWAVMLVSFSYSGWNAAAYLAGEIRNPRQGLFIALGLGAAAVTLIYLLLNAVFLWSVPMARLAGVVDVASVAADALLGPVGARCIAGLVAFGLCSSVGGLIFAGPRVYESVGHDYAALSWLSTRGEQRGPWRATLLQTAVTVVLLFSASFEQLLGYVGFILSLFSALVVLGAFVLDRREPDLPRPLRTKWQPLLGGVALVVLLAAPLWAIVEQPALGLGGLCTLAVGLTGYLAVKNTHRAA